MSINLSGLSVAKKAQKRRDRMFSYSILFAFLVLLITGGIYVALNIYSQTLQADIDKKVNETDIELTKLSGKDAKRVIDVANRIDKINKYYTSSSIPFDLLERVNGLLVDDVVLGEYGYEVDESVAKVEIVFVAEDFLSVARQVAKLKQSNDFDKVSLKDVDRDSEDNIVRFVISLDTALADMAKTGTNIDNNTNNDLNNVGAPVQVLSTESVTTYNGLNTQENWNPIPEN